jgi:hypothetical protein
MNHYFHHHDLHSHPWPGYRSGLGFGVPGWRLGDIGTSNPKDGRDWTTVAKVALVVGGALAVYAIYRASKVAEPIAERTGEAAAQYLIARGGGAGALGAAKKNGKHITVSRGDYKLLTE